LWLYPRQRSVPPSFEDGTDLFQDD